MKHLVDLDELENRLLDFHGKNYEHPDGYLDIEDCADKEVESWIRAIFFAERVLVGSFNLPETPTDFCFVCKCSGDHTIKPGNPICLCPECATLGLKRLIGILFPGLRCDA